MIKDSFYLLLMLLLEHSWKYFIKFKKKVIAFCEKFFDIKFTVDRKKFFPVGLFLQNKRKSFVLQKWIYFLLSVGKP